MTEPYDKRWRLLLYGAPKVGKTSLAETAPGPRLILDAEGGTDWLATDVVEWNFPDEKKPSGKIKANTSVVVRIKDWKDLERLLTFLQKGKHPFRSVILDSITELQKQAKKQVTETGMRLQDWGTLYDLMDPVLRGIRDLTQIEDSPVECVVIVALQNSKSEDEKSKVFPDIQGAMARSLAGQMDTIGYLAPAGMNASGTRDRELVVDASKGIEAGDRTKVLRRTFGGAVPIELDDDDDTLSWNIVELMDLMNGRD